MTDIQGSAPRPCESCPYRKDTPSGVWAASEYVKLALYDRETPLQPAGLFQCHQHDADSQKQVPRVCAGWAGTHGPQIGNYDLMSVRMAVAFQRIDWKTAQKIYTYRSPVPLFSSGREAAEHGMREIENPSPEARRISEKIVRIRTNIEFG